MLLVKILFISNSDINISIHQFILAMSNNIFIIE